MRSLILTEHGLNIKRQGETFLITKKGEILEKIPAMEISDILVFASTYLTSGALHLAAQKKIPVAYLSKTGNLKFYLESAGRKRAHLLRRQLQKTKDEKFCLEFARNIVDAKLANMASLLQRQRNVDEVKRNLFELKNIRKKLEDGKSIETIRGLEGIASSIYFRMYAKFLEPWKFPKRIPRPAPDPINAMLSLGYSLLHNHLRALLTVYGFSIYDGFFHQVRSGHAALASDLIEPFRSLVVDSVVLQMTKKKMLQKEDFEIIKSRCQLKDKALKTYLEQYVKRLNQSFVWPRKTGTRLCYQEIIIMQIRNLEQSLQTGEYFPFTLGT